MNKIIFKIPGEPVGKGRPKFGRLKGGGVSVRTPEKTINFENLVKISFDETGAEPFSSSAQISATITAYFQPPKSASKKKLAQMTTGELRPTKKPDADNIAKAVLDALNGLAYHDDAQVVELHVSKAYAEQAHTIVQLQEIQLGGTITT